MFQSRSNHLGVFHVLVRQRDVSYFLSCSVEVPFPRHVQRIGCILHKIARIWLSRGWVRIGSQSGQMRSLIHFYDWHPEIAPRKIGDNLHVVPVGPLFFNIVAAVPKQEGLIL